MAQFIKHFFSVLIALLIVFVVIKGTTVGWQVSSAPASALTPEQQKSVQAMKAVVEELSGRIGNRNYAEPEKLEMAHRYIANQFKSLGYRVESFPFQIGQQTFKNIIAKKSKRNGSRSSSADLLVIGAHYDTCFNPGADDNASGVAGLIEAARVLKNEELSFEVQFIAFANEEPPFFQSDDMGSRRFTRWLKTQPVNVKGAIILEMIGYFREEKFSQTYFPLVGPFYPNKGNFIALIGNFPSRHFLNEVHRGFKAAKQIQTESLIAPEFIPGITWSDHWSFWQEGWPAIIVTDTAYLRSPHYHQKSDLPATLNYDEMARVVTALKEAVLGLSQ